MNRMADERDPEDRERVDPLVVAAEVPGASLELLARPVAEEDRQHEGDVEADHGDRRPTRSRRAGFHSVGSISAPGRARRSPSTAVDGDAVALTPFHSRWPGTAPSREKANIIRDADVVDAIVQKHCATTAMRIRNSAQCCPSRSARCSGRCSAEPSTAPCGDRERDGHEQDEPEEDRDDDRHDHAPGGADARRSGSPRSCARRRRSP